VLISELKKTSKHQPGIRHVLHVHLAVLAGRRPQQEQPQRTVTTGTGAPTQYPSYLGLAGTATLLHACAYRRVRGVAPRPTTYVRLYMHTELVPSY
jgi:hypothetical protein